MTEEHARDWHLKILFDGDCPFCRLEARWLGRWDKHERLVFEDIADPAFDPGQYGLERDDVHALLHGVLPDGRVLQGMIVFREAYRAVGAGWLFAPTGWPVLRPIFDRLYLLFARHRVRLGGLFGRKGCDADACTPRSAGSRDPRGNARIP